MNGSAAATAPFAGFAASVWTCVALLRRSWVLLGLSLVTWSAVVGCMALDVSRVFVIGASVISSAALLLSLRSHLLGAGLYLPASARTRSLAIALVGTLASLAGFMFVAGLGGLVPAVRGLIDPTLPGAILATGAVSVLPELMERKHPWLDRVSTVVLVGALTWRAGPDATRSGDLFRLLPVAAAGVLLLVTLLPKSWLKYPAPAFLQVGIRDTAFPAGVADPILAVRALLAAERGRSVGWRLVPLAPYALALWGAYGLGPGDRPVWDLVGWVGLPLFAMIPFILPISAFGVEAAGVALELPVPPLKVHHAVIREATIRAGVVFGVFSAYEALRFGIRALTVTPVTDAAHVPFVVLLGLYSWPIPAFALCLGASAWLSYPSPLRVFLVKVAAIGASIPLALGFSILRGPSRLTLELIMQRWVHACALLTLLGLLALLLGELRARRAFRPYRSVA